MKTKQKHTPTPWILTGDSESPIKNVLTMEDNNACGDPECCGEVVFRPKISDADLRLIVRAVNSVEALEEENKRLKHSHEALLNAVCEASELLGGQSVLSEVIHRLEAIYDIFGKVTLDKQSNI